MNKILVVAIASAMALVSGCGKTKKSSPISWTDLSLTKNPIFLFKQDKSCQGIFAEDSDKEFSISQFMGGFEVRKTYIFNDQIFGNYIRNSNPILKTTYNSKTSMIIDIAWDESINDYKRTKFPDFSIDSYGSDLDVCPTTTSYSELSVENSGLNASRSITKTFNAIKKADPSLSLKPISLNISPSNKTIVRFSGGKYDKYRSSLYETDNAYYDPSNLEIRFLPQSKEYKSDKLYSAPFWEIPIVGSHEYGHHVFNTIIASKISDQIAFSKTCFNTKKHEDQKIVSSSDSDLRDNSYKFALRSMNEGFADLIASYTLDDSEISLKHVDCFEDSREINSNSFGNGDSKEINYAAKYYIDYTYTFPAPKDCNAPNFQEIHNVGAVFAHAFDKLISKTTENKERKLEILLDWAKAFAKDADSLQSLPASEYLFAAIELAYKIALEKKGETVNQLHCGSMNTIFTYGHSINCRYLK